MSVNVATITGAARNYVEILFRRKWLFIAPVIIFTSIGIALGFILPPRYRSEALLALKEEQIENPHIKGVAAVTPIRERLPVLREKLTSRTRLLSVIRELGLDAPLNDQWALEGLIGSLRESISVDLRERGHLLSISCEHQDPLTCQKVVELLTDLFIRENVELEKKETSIGIDFLESQRAYYRQKLEEAEKNLTKFKEKHQQRILSMEAAKELGEKLGVSSSTNINVLRYTTYEGNLIEMRLQLKELYAKQKHLQQELTKTDHYIISARVQEINPIARELKKTLAEKRIELARLLVDSTENHPMVQQLKRQIEKTREELEQITEETVKQETRSINPLYQDIVRELGKTNTEIEALKERISITELFLKDFNKEIKEIPETEKTLTDLQRSYNIFNQRYLDLTDRLETAKITRRLDALEKWVKFEIYERPRIPLHPFKPNRKGITLIGLVAGIFFGGALVFIAEATDHSFSDVSQLRLFLDIPVLGSVSRILTVEEEELNRARKRLGLIMLLVVILFIFLGVVAKYILTAN